MTILNPNTKRAQNFINAYSKSQICDIYGAYCNPSVAKVQAFRSIERMAAGCGAISPVYILSAGVQFFTTGYECRVNDTPGLVVNTYCNKFFIPWVE